MKEAESTPAASGDGSSSVGFGALAGSRGLAGGGLHAGDVCSEHRPILHDWVARIAHPGLVEPSVRLVAARHESELLWHDAWADPVCDEPGPAGRVSRQCAIAGYPDGLRERG